MTRDELQVIVEIRDALDAIKRCLRELAEATDRVAKAIEQAAEEIRDAQ